MVKLFIVGFSREMDELQLLELFSEHGLVNTVTIVRDQITGTSKGYAFMDMLDGHGADRAITALNNATIGGRTLSVRIAENKRAQTQNELVPSQQRNQRQVSSPALNDNHRKSSEGRRPRRKKL